MVGLYLLSRCTKLYNRSCNTAIKFVVLNIGNRNNFFTDSLCKTLLTKQAAWKCFACIPAYTCLSSHKHYWACCLLCTLPSSFKFLGTWKPKCEMIKHVMYEEWTFVKLIRLESIHNYMWETAFLWLFFLCQWIVCLVYCYIHAFASFSMICGSRNTTYRILPRENSAYYIQFKPQNFLITMHCSFRDLVMYCRCAINLIVFSW